jgi:hypothetical protein
MFSFLYKISISILKLKQLSGKWKKYDPSILCENIQKQNQNVMFLRDEYERVVDQKYLAIRRNKRIIGNDSIRLCI